MASISSKNIMVGATCRAFLNISCMAFSESPNHFDSNSGPRTLMKLAFVSLATAFAISVLPVPGGPYINTPLGGLIPILINFSGCFRGHSTASIISVRRDPNPPTSLHLTLGISTNTSLIDDGSISVSYTHLRAHETRHDLVCRLLLEK